ncbi:hypothetical protein Patl1_04300 [Pistacia atlantica]|uniref:Uncharacterized protein n=1 Tax=Pistacia atlantica TaxID=434234 RepID=A0ACC1BRG1_9ROSI|nr:hypothetical protein Patl1_04300 [Pistacia atlantica]
MCMQQEIKGSQGGRWLSTDVNQRQQCFRQCCQELQEVDRRCRCQNLKQMVRHQQQQEQFRVRRFRNFMKQPVNCLAYATFHPFRVVSSVHPIRLTAMSGG